MSWRNAALFSTMIGMAALSACSDDLGVNNQPPGVVRINETSTGGCFVIGSNLGGPERTEFQFPETVQPGFCTVADFYGGAAGDQFTLRLPDKGDSDVPGQWCMIGAFVNQAGELISANLQVVEAIGEVPMGIEIPQGETFHLTIVFQALGTSDESCIASARIGDPVMNEWFQNGLLSPQGNSIEA